MNTQNYLTLVCSAKQRGVALVETLLLSAPIIVFLIGLPSLGKLIDAQQSTILASRYAAWQHTINSPIASPEEIRSTFFTNQAAGAVSGSIVDRSRFQLSNQSVEASVSEVDADSGLGVAKAIGSAISRSAKLLDKSNWDLTPVGVVSSQVNLTVEHSLPIFSSLGGCSSNTDQQFCLSESNGIMVDGWNSGNDAMTQTRAKSFVPTSKLSKIGGYLSKLGRIPMLEELKGIKTALGCIRTDVLPGRTVDQLPVYRSNGAPQC